MHLKKKLFLFNSNNDLPVLRPFPKVWPRRQPEGDLRFLRFRPENNISKNIEYIKVVVIYKLHFLGIL